MCGPYALRIEFSSRLSELLKEYSATDRVTALSTQVYLLNNKSRVSESTLCVRCLLGIRPNLLSGCIDCSLLLL